MGTIFEGRKFLVLGAGVTGLAVARCIGDRKGIVTITDEYRAGAIRPEEIILDDYDAAVVSPGWKPDHPLISMIMASSLEILNEIDLAWQLRNEIAPRQKWLALTGTNGKTTTVEMTAKILQDAGFHAVACGNVGDTVIDAVDRENPFDYLILELSSFQLHWIKEAEFEAVAILNIAQDHLDWHGDFDSYAAAKFSILHSADLAILNGDDPQVVLRSNSWPGKKIFFSLDTPGPGEMGVVEELLVDRAFVVDSQEAGVICELADVKPTVPHNILNALAAAALARSVNVPLIDIQKSLRSFRPGRHRIETVYESDSITWVDDSKATNPHAAAASILSHLSVIWIAGGLAKGADMEEVVMRCHKRLKAVILIGQDAQLIEDALIKHAPQIPRKRVSPPANYEKGSESNLFMDEVVAQAKQLAGPADTVLLAPACASMDQFQSYVDRGDRFAASVKKIVAHER